MDLFQDFLREEGLSEGASIGTDPLMDSSAMPFSVIVASSVVSGIAALDGVGECVRRDLCGSPGMGDKGGALLTILSIIIALELKKKWS